GAARNAHRAAREARIPEQPRILQRALGRAHGELRHAPHAARLLACPVRRQLEGIDRGCELGVEVGEELPLRHVAHGVARGLEDALDLAPARPECGNPAHARDDDAPSLAHTRLILLQKSPPFTAITWRVT